MTALERAALKRKPTRRFYGYGIVGKSGKPFLGQSCVCDDQKLLMTIVDKLNDYPNDDIPYRVARLFYETRKR